MTLLGKRLRQARYAAGYSLPEAQAKAGVHESYISKLERQNYNPTIAVLLKLAAAYGTTASELLKGIES